MPVTLKSVSSLFRGLVRGVLEGPDDDAELPDDVDGYSITGRIGRGGMGAVYLAKDTTLDSNVAIKFVAGFDQADENSRGRFLREAKAMAAVHHPNIVHVYGFGESDGRPYIVMEYVEGESVADRLKSNGPLDIDEALWVLHQTICALAAAWEKGLVHRDIKPSNLLVDDKAWLRVCDFGLAKAGGSDFTAMTTASGDIAGTPHYMSPEQATGREVDFRSDIYSLGVVLYELVVGRPPFTGDSPGALIAQHLQTPVPDVSTTGRSKRWGQIAGLIAWMTEKDPDRRPGSYDELLERVEELIENPRAFAPWILERLRAKRRRRWLLAAAAVVLSTGLVGGGLWYAGFLEEPPTIAVLPFEYLGSDPEWEQLGLVIADGLTANFQRSRRTEVVPLATIQGLGPTESLTQLAELLSADWVVHGDVSVAEDELVFGFELQSADGRQVERGIHSGDIQELGATLDSLSAELFVMLELAVETGSGLNDWRSVSTSAWRHYAAGLEAAEDWYDTEMLEEAAQHYRDAIDIDPQMAVAHARLAMTLYQLARRGSEDPAAMTGEARRHAERASNRNPDMPESLIALGLANLVAGQTGLGQQQLREALEIAPGNDAALREIARFYAARGGLDDAEAAYETAIEVRPNYWRTHYDLGRFFVFDSTDPQRAREHLDAANLLTPSPQPAILVLLGGLVYSEGDWESAEGYFEQAVSLDPENAYARNMLAFLYYSLGSVRRAHEEWLAVLEGQPELPISHANVGDALVQLGRREEAIPYYQRARELYSNILSASGADPEVQMSRNIVNAALGECETAVPEAHEILERQSDSQPLRYYALFTASRCGDLDWATELATGLIENGSFVRDIDEIPDFEGIREIPAVKAVLDEALSRR